MTELGQMAALESGAIFSPCRRWRYVLWRRWDERAGACAFIGLNPSTADELKNDPTITRCINYAKWWGFGSLFMLNIFAYRATEPLVMKAQGADAVGPCNDEWLSALRADLTVAAWGTHGTFRDREAEVRRLFASRTRALHVLRLTKAGHPAHPLYLPGDLTPVVWPLVHAVA